MHLNKVYQELIKELKATGNTLTAEQFNKELDMQRKTLKLIASENYCSLIALFSHANLFSDKYAEGCIGKRFYSGCEQLDAIEDDAVTILKRVFKVDHAYVQPHSGADANLVAYMAVIGKFIEEKGLDAFSDQGKRPKNIMSLSQEEFFKLRSRLNGLKMLGMDLNAGGHLTHGYRMNISSLLFEPHYYGVDQTTGLISYDEIATIAKREKPQLIVAGYSAYPRKIDFALMRSICDEVGATLMVDMAHFSGLVAGGVWKGKYDPAKYADIITSTTHKTLRCPRGGIVLCKEAYKPYVDKGCPHVLGGPLGQVIAAKGVAFRELETPEFKDYAHQVVRNAQALAQALVEGGAKILTGGTDNHMVIIDVEESFGLNGRQAEKALLAIGISLNRNTIPNDKNGPWYTSGVRLGTPACTTRGLKEDDMKQIGQWMCSHLHAVKPDPDSKANYYVDNAKETEMASAVQNMLLQFPLYPELD